MLGLRFGLGLGLAISYQVNFGTWAATAILVKDAFWQQPARTCKQARKPGLTAPGLRLHRLCPYTAVGAQ